MYLSVRVAKERLAIDDLAREMRVDRTSQYTALTAYGSTEPAKATELTSYEDEPEPW